MEFFTEINANKEDGIPLVNPLCHFITLINDRNNRAEKEESFPHFLHHHFKYFQLHGRDKIQFIFYDHVLAAF